MRDWVRVCWRGSRRNNFSGTMWSPSNQVLTFRNVCTLSFITYPARMLCTPTTYRLFHSVSFWLLWNLLLLFRELMFNIHRWPPYFQERFVKIFNLRMVKFNKKVLESRQQWTCVWATDNRFLNLIKNLYNIRYLFFQLIKWVHIPFILVSFEGGTKTACAAFDYPWVAHTYPKFIGVPLNGK